MTVNMQNPAGRNGGVCESTHLETRDASQDTTTRLNSQDIVLGSVKKNGREEFRVTLKSFSDLRLIDVRVFKNVGGADVGTPQGVAVKPERLRGLIDILELAEDAAKAEGLV